MSTDILIEARGLSRYFDQHAAVRDLDLQLSKGDVLGFLGPNGAGKSTTMNMLTGNLAPSAGSVSINGIDLLDDPRAAKAALGYLPEVPPLYPELTVHEYLSFCAALNRIARPQRTTAINDALERCGLGEVARRLIGNLSKGFQQRVGIAQAIIHMPPVVILDEPTVGLDPLQIGEIRRLITELANNHTVILSTHILPEVLSVCNRVHIMHCGRLVHAGDLQEFQASASPTWRLGAHALPDDSSLSTALSADISRVDAEHVDVTFDQAGEHGERLLGLAQQNHWRPFEAWPVARSLEQLFTDLTSSDPADLDTRDAAA